VKATLPNSVTENNKVKNIKGGRLNTSILLQDGTVWSTGNGTSRQVSDMTSRQKRSTALNTSGSAQASSRFQTTSRSSQQQKFYNPNILTTISTRPAGM